MSGYVPLQAPWLQGGGGGGNSLGSNPLAMMGEAMKLRQGMQEWNARQQLGNLFASSPDMDTALEKARQDPLVSQFPQFMTELRNQRLLDTQTQQAQLGQANSGREAVQNAVMNAGNDPAALLPAMQRQLSSLSYLPKNVQQQVLAHGQTIAENLTHGLDKIEDPDQRAAAYAKNRAQFMISHGMKPEEAYAAGGGTFMAPQVVEIPQADGSVRKQIIGGPMGSLGQGGGTAGAPGTSTLSLGQGQSTEQKEFATKTGQAAGDLQQEIAANSGSIPITVARFDMMQDALGRFQAGGLADVRSEFAKVMQGAKNIGLPVTQAQIDAVGNKSLTDSQVFNSQIKPFVVSALKESAQGTGRVMRSEVDQFLAMADQTTDPVALMRILNMARRSLQVGYDRSEKFTEFRQALGKNDPSVQGLNLTDFNSWYNKNFKEENLVGQTPGGLKLGPRPELEAKGAKDESKATLRYNQTTKKFEPIP